MADLRLLVLVLLLCLFNVVENESRVLQGEQSLTEIVDNDRQQMATSSPVLVKKDTVPSLARTEQETLELVDDSTHRGTNEKKTSSANVNKKYATNGGLKGQLGFLSKEETSLIDQNVNNVLKYYGLGPNVEAPNTMNIKGETKKMNKGNFGQNNGSNQLFKAKKPESARNSGTLKQGVKVSLQQVGRTLSTQHLGLAGRKNNKLQEQRSKMDSSKQKNVIRNNPLRGNTNVAKPFNMGRNSFDRKNSVHDGPQSSRLQPFNMGRNSFDKKNSVHNGPQSSWLPIKENLKLFQDYQNQDGQATKAALEYMRMPNKGILNLVQNEAKQAQRQTPPLGTQGTNKSRGRGNIAVPVWVPVKEDTDGIQFDVNEGSMQNGMGQEHNGRPITHEMQNGMTQEQNGRPISHKMENEMGQKQNGRPITHELQNGMTQEQNGRPITNEMENGMGQEQNGRPITHEMQNGMGQEQNGRPITHEMQNGMTQEQNGRPIIHEMQNGMTQEQKGRTISHEMQNGMTQEQNGRPISHEMENEMGQKQNGRPITHELQNGMTQEQNGRPITNEMENGMGQEMQNGMGQERNGRPITHEMQNGMTQEQNGMPIIHEMQNGMTQEQKGRTISHEMQNGMTQEQNGRPISHEMQNGMTQEQNGRPMTHEIQNGMTQEQNGKPNLTHEMQKDLSQNEKSIENDLMPFKDALSGLHHDKTQDRYMKTLTNSSKNLGMKMEMQNDSWQEMESMKPDENVNKTGGANDSNDDDVIRNHTGMAGTSKTQYSATEISGNNHNKQLQSTNTSKEKNEYMMEFDMEGENVQPNNLTFKIQQENSKNSFDQTRNEQENSKNSFDQTRNEQENSKNSFDQIRNEQENSKNSFDQIRKEQDVTKQIWSSGKVIHSQGHESLQITSWSPWSTCSETCGGNGLQIRTRKCTHAQKEQPACDENAIDWKWCIGVDVCPDSGLHIVNHENNSTYASVTIEGQALPSQWGSWSSCSKRCGSQSLRVRTRKCPGQRSRTTAICVKPTMQWTWCKPNPCKGAQDARKIKTLYNNPSKPTNSINTDDEATSPVIHTDRGLAFQDDCIVSPWSKWSKCSKSCGENSFKFRTRTCSCGYKKLCKKPSLERQHCHLKKCRGEENYGPWSAFSPCTKSCDGGWKKRTRRCKVTSNGRHLCDQDLLIGVKVCNTQQCQQASKDGMIANVNPKSMCGFNPCSEFSCMDNPDSKCLADTNCDPVFFNMFGQIDSKCRGWQRYQVRNPALFCGYDPCLHSQCQRLFGRCSVDLNCKAFILGADGSVIECNKIRYPF